MAKVEVNYGGMDYNAIRYKEQLEKQEAVYRRYQKLLKAGQTLTEDDKQLYYVLENSAENRQQELARIHTEVSKEMKMKYKPKNFQDDYYNQFYEPDLTEDVKRNMRKSPQGNRPADNIIQDYVQPREKSVKDRVKKATPQEADVTDLTAEEYKKKLETALKVDENDPGSSANIAVMKKSGETSRTLSDKYQADVIKKYVPALSTTPAPHNESPKKPSTRSNYTPTNPEMFMDEVTVIDSEWISSRFLVPSKDLMSIDRINRFFSTTGWKYNSTQLGANIAINAKPQFTRYADIRGNNRSVMNPNMASYKDESFNQEMSLGFSVHLGIGRYYSEAIDDNQTLVFLEFGHPKFNNLFTFFVRAVTYEDMYIANHGTTPTGYYLGKAVGVIFNLYFFPLTTIIIYGAKALFSFFASGPLDYYYFNSAMPQYWAVANQILNKMAVELGIINPIFQNKQPEASKIGTQATIDQDDFRTLESVIPGAFYPSTNYIDLFYIACRPQILANKHSKAEYEAFNKSGGATVKDFIGYVTDGEQYKEKFSPGSNAAAWWDAEIFRATNLVKFFQKWVLGEDSEFKPKEPSEMNEPLPSVADPSAASSSNNKEGKDDGSNKNSNYPDGAIRETPGFFSSLKSMGDKVFKNMEHKAEVLDATTREGAKYAVFAVDFQGAQSESFSNSTSDIELGGILKGAGGAARNVKFNLSGGNLLPGLTEAGDMIRNFAAGALDSVSFGLSNVISTLLGNAFIEFPKKWDDSDISLPQISYTMTLVSPYGNAISQLQNIYIPLAMLLAGSLPLATGERSYTSPFLCAVFNKGVQKIKLGMITSLSITRGTSSLPFSRWKKPLAVEVSFTITDFSTKMAAPVNSGIFGGEFNMRLEQDNKFDEYIGVLCGKDIYTDIYFFPKLKKKISRLAMALTQTFVGSQSAVHVGDSMLFRWMGLFTKERNFGSNQSNNIYY